jgi:hypothetical protein
VVKLDLRKQLKHLYSPPADVFTLIDVPDMNFLMVDGYGDPNAIGSDFQDAMQVLYPVAYTVKFAVKKSRGVDFPVMPPEGLWWTGADGSLDTRRKDRWSWTLMLMQPDVVTAEDVAAALEAVRAKKDPPGLGRVRFERFAEGRSVQILYIGSYADEGPVIARMHEFIRESGLQPAGKHHEIYLGDPRRSAPSKLKTVLRQPVRRL